MKKIIVRCGNCSGENYEVAFNMPFVPEIGTSLKLPHRPDIDPEGVTGLSCIVTGVEHDIRSGDIVISVPILMYMHEDRK